MTLDAVVNQPPAPSLPAPPSSIWSRARSVWRLRAELEERPCPLCGEAERWPVVRYERFFLPIEVAMCRRCGFVYAARMFDAAGAERFYQRTYADLMYDRRPDVTQEMIDSSADHGRFHLDRINEVVPSFSAVLDVGCGFGHFLAECRGQGAEVYGSEPGDDRLLYAQQTLGLGAAATAEPFETGRPPPFTPDLVTMFHTLEHLLDPVQVLKRAHELMAPDGWLVVEVPDLMGPWASHGVSFIYIGHCTYFTVETLSLTLAKSGFVVRSVTRAAEPGIYPANLRVFAQKGEAGAIAPPPDIDAARRHVKAHLHAWSTENGYPAWALKLVRAVLGISRPSLRSAPTLTLPHVRRGRGLDASYPLSRPKGGGG